MNRRDLFKFLGAGAAGLLIPSTTSYFLAPRGGWVQNLKMRMIQQYCISDDSYPIQYDATWDLPNGEPVQMYIRFDPIPTMDVWENPAIFADQHRKAQDFFMQKMREQNGSPNSSKMVLRLPLNTDRAVILT